MDNLRKPSLWLGALVGGLLTMTLMSLLFLADQVAGLPFIPFDVFDYVSRILPGALLTFGIDMMVEMIIAFNMGETSAAAKTAEQLMGLGAFLVLGTAAITVVYGLMNRSKTQRAQSGPRACLGLGFRRGHDADFFAGESDGDRPGSGADHLGGVDIRALGDGSQLDIQRSGA